MVIVDSARLIVGGVEHHCPSPLLEPGQPQRFEIGTHWRWLPEFELQRSVVENCRSDR
jgi:hypothetical protein